MVSTTPREKPVSGLENELPDYFLGRLIYKATDGDACKWVVYDGDKKHRFPSRAAAEKWCIAHTYQVTREDLGELMTIHARLSSSYTKLDEIAPKFTDEKEVIEALALAVRTVTDKIDLIISRHV